MISLSVDLSFQLQTQEQTKNTNPDKSDLCTMTLTEKFVEVEFKNM